MLQGGAVLRGRPARPDRLTHDADPFPGMGPGERVEHAWDDPAGVAAHLGHVHELDVARVHAEGGTQPLQMRIRHRDQHRLVQFPPFAEKPLDAGHVLVGVEVQQRLVNQPRTPGLRRTHGTST